MAIVNLNNPRKTDASLWAGQPAGTAAGLVQQSALEASNTDPIRSIIDMTVSQRAFDSGQKILRAIDDSLSLAAAVAKVN